MLVENHPVPLKLMSKPFLYFKSTKLTLQPKEKKKLFHKEVKIKQEEQSSHNSWSITDTMAASIQTFIERHSWLAVPQLCSATSERRGEQQNCNMPCDSHLDHFYTSRQ